MGQYNFNTIRFQMNSNIIKGAYYDINNNSIIVTIK